MKKSIFLLVCVLVCACTSERLTEEVQSFKDTVVKEISIKMPQLERDNISTRTIFESNEQVIHAVWAEGDTIGIFPFSGGQVEFPIISNSGNETAIFNGGGWGLKESYSYSAYFPFNVNYRNNKTIPLDYTGQVQTGNNNTDHLSTHDYMASGSFQARDGKLNFNMKRLGCILKLEMAVPRTSRYTQLYLISDNVEFVTKAELDISGEEPKVKAKETDKSILLDLKNISLNEGEVLTAYLMISPIDLSSSNLSVRLRSSIGYHTAKFKARLFEANNPYKFEISTLVNTLVNQNLINSINEWFGLQFEKNEDGTVPLDNKKNLDIVNYVNFLNLSEKNDSHITDEIGWFKNITELQCWSNQLTSLDVSNNTALTSLYCFNNQLTTLDLSNNTALYFLDCNSNQLTNLDVSNNAALGEIDCSHNQINELDLTNNTSLRILNCLDNNLKSLIVNNTGLYELNCYNNQLTRLIVSNNAKLKTLNCYDNQLTTLDVTNNTALTSLSCSNNQLATLDVTNNTALVSLRCSNNQLATLDVTNKDKLRHLYCSNNQLTTLDLSSNKTLMFFECNNNQLTTLDVTNNTALASLTCSNNQLTTLDVTNNTNLTTLYCNNNKLMELDLSKNTRLFNLRAYDCHLLSIDISGCNNLSLTRTYVGHQLDSLGSIQEITLLVNEKQYNEKLLNYSHTGGPSINYHINDNVKVILKE